MLCYFLVYFYFILIPINIFSFYPTFSFFFNYSWMKQAYNETSLKWLREL